MFQPIKETPTTIGRAVICIPVSFQTLILREKSHLSSPGLSTFSLQRHISKEKGQQNSD
jgi:hypothetical protein